MKPTSKTIAIVFGILATLILHDLLDSPVIAGLIGGVLIFTLRVGLENQGNNPN